MEPTRFQRNPENLEEPTKGNKSLSPKEEVEVTSFMQVLKGEFSQEH